MEGAAVLVSQGDVFKVSFEEFGDKDAVLLDELVIVAEESARKERVVSQTLKEHELLFVDFEAGFFVLFEQGFILFERELFPEESFIELPV